MKIIGFFLLIISIGYFTRQYVFHKNSEFLEPKVEYQFRPETYANFFENTSLSSYYEPMFTTYHQRVLYSYLGPKDTKKKG